MSAPTETTDLNQLAAELAKKTGELPQGGLLALHRSIRETHLDELGEADCAELALQVYELLTEPRQDGA